MLQKIKPVIWVIPVLFVMLTTSASGQQSFSITGKLNPTVEGVLILSYIKYEQGKERYSEDSAIVKNGRFSFTGKVQNPVLAQFRLLPLTRTSRDRGSFARFYLEPGTITVKSDSGLNQAIIAGGAEQQVYSAWQSKRKSLADTISKLSEIGYKMGKNMNDEGVRAIQKAMTPMLKELDAIDSSFMAINADSKVVFDQWYQELKRNKLNVQLTEARLNRFPKKIRQLPPAMMLAATLAIEKKLQPGKPAPTFTLNDLTGKPVSLSFFRGRYVLLQFTRYTNMMTTESMLANLQRVNSRLKMDNLTILSVLDDPDTEQVATLISEKGVDWVHVTRNGLEGDKDPASKYGLKEATIRTFLIGPDGNFVLTDLDTGSDLVTQIKSAVPGAEAQLSKTRVATTADAPLNVFEGEAITAYPNVEWIKGAPVTHFDKDTIYIVELWATWCVPCIAAMPHLSELQRKFKDKKVVIIAQQVWEEDKKKVVEFVAKKGSDLDYRVAFSGPRGSDFDKRWCIPAQVTGIPRTFVIQDGKLVWQTHPMRLTDDVLQLLVDKQFTKSKAEALQSH